MAVEALVGKVPENWEYTTLGEACARGGGDIQTGPFGSQLHASDYVANGIPSIMPQNIGDNRVVPEGIARITEHDAERLSRYRVRPSDIVYSRRGDVERRALIRPSEDGWLCGTGCLRVRFGGSQISPAYASYYLGDLRVREWIVRHAHGATMPNLNTSILSELPFVVPPSDEQQNIGRILGAFDDTIELNRQMNETLEAIAQALFSSWFVDFDPVHARAEGHDPNLPKSLAEMFPSTFQSSGVGVVPRGWRLVPLPEAIEVNPSRSLRRGEVAPYLDMANMPTRGHAPDSVINRPFGSGMRFSNGDTLVARITPCLENGKTAYVDFLESQQIGWGSTEYIVLRPKEPLPPEYAYYLARSALFREFAIQSMTGSSGRQRVPAEALAHFRVVVPSEQIAVEFGKFVAPLVARMSAVTKQSRILVSLRDALLPKLVSGELRLPEADRIIGGKV